MWFRSLSHSHGQSSRRAAGRPRARVPRSLRLEPLEELCLPSFFSPVSYPVGSLPQAVVAADFNNDARPDLAVTNYLDNTVSVLLGNPDGTFQPARNSATGNNPSSLAVGDFDADGKNDLVARGFDAKDAHEAAKANPAARRARAIVDLDRAT